MQPTTPRIYSFGEFALDLTQGCLLHNGEPVKLRPKVFEVLRYLVENSNRLVSKDELVEVVWADAIVTDNSLVQCLKEARAALHDNAHNLIKTVPRRGYIFIAKVNEAKPSSPHLAFAEQFEGIKIVIEDIEERESANPVAEPALTQPSRSLMSAPKPYRAIEEVIKTPKARLAVGLLPLILLVGAIGYYWRTASPSSANKLKAISIRITQPTILTNSGDVYGAAISPNGQYLVYIWLRPQTRSLRVQHLSTGSTIEILPPIPSHLQPTCNYWGVLFSADSNYIYYLLVDDGENLQGALFRVPVLGGHSQKVISHVNSAFESPDGKHIAFIRTNQIPGLSRLMICNRDGTNEQILSTIDTNSRFNSLGWSPDGTNILYVFRQYTPEGYFHYLAEIPASGGTEHRLIQPRRERIIAAAWLPDKSGLMMNAVDAQTNLPQIYFVAYPGGEVQQLTNDWNNYKGLTITADGRTVVSEVSGGTTNLWLMPKDAPRQAVSLASSSRGWYYGLSWTPDKQLVYNAYENGVSQICKMTIDGSHRQQLTSAPGHNADASVTPDGRFMVFYSTRSGSAQIWRMTVNGDDPVQLTHSHVGVFKPQTSPDSQWVYYTADVQGSWQVWKVPITGGKEELVEAAPVKVWAISPDGKMLAYSFFDEQNKQMQVAVRRLDENEPFRYFDIAAEVKLEWTRDGRALTYINSQSTSKNIWVQLLDGEEARPLTALGADQWIAAYAWSPDGEALAYTRVNTTFDVALLQLK
ncbi:MAG: winged helix-turn-helix domain-containing protein [Acidobacteriota bacterium]